MKYRSESKIYASALAMNMLLPFSGNFFFGSNKFLYIASIINCIIFIGNKDNVIFGLIYIKYSTLLSVLVFIVLFIFSVRKFRENRREITLRSTSVPLVYIILLFMNFAIDQNYNTARVASGGFSPIINSGDIVAYQYGSYTERGDLIVTLSKAGGRKLGVAISVATEDFYIRNSEIVVCRETGNCESIMGICPSKRRSTKGEFRSSRNAILFFTGLNEDVMVDAITSYSDNYTSKNIEEIGSARSVFRSDNIFSFRIDLDGIIDRYCGIE